MNGRSQCNGQVKDKWRELTFIFGGSLCFCGGPLVAGAVGGGHTSAPQISCPPQPCEGRVSSQTDAQQSKMRQKVKDSGNAKQPQPEHTKAC